MARGILIVDDDIDDCQIVVESLQQIGWNNQIDFVHGGLEALEFLEAKNKLNASPVVIIIDLRMPMMSGLELLAQIKQYYKNVPVILYSTACTDELIKQAKQAGAVDCVKKGTSYMDNLKLAHLVLSLANSSINKRLLEIY